MCPIPHEKVKETQLTCNMQNEIIRFHYRQIRMCLRVDVSSFILRGSSLDWFNLLAVLVNGLYFGSLVGGWGRWVWGVALGLSLIFWAWADHGWFLVLFSTTVAITYPSASGVWIFLLSPRLPVWLLSYTSAQHGFASESN